MENVFPDKFSAFIRVALDDLKSVENDPQYKVDMTKWHQFNRDTNVCEVCLAGAMIARKFHGDPLESLLPSDFSVDVRKKIYALDDLSIGFVDTAYCLFANKKLETLTTMELSPEAKVTLQRYINRDNVPDYELNSDEFFRYFYGMADDLEKIGL